MVIAADYPFLDVFWTMVLFFLWVAWIWTLIVVLGDVFRRHDTSAAGARPPGRCSSSSCRSSACSCT